MVIGATASATITLGRNRAQSLPSSTACSAPSTSILRKSICFGAYSRQIARSVVTGTGNDLTGRLNSFCAACALASTVVERPWKPSTR